MTMHAGTGGHSLVTIVEYLNQLEPNVKKIGTLLAQTQGHSITYAPSYEKMSTDFDIKQLSTIQTDYLT